MRFHPSSRTGPRPRGRFAPPAALAFALAFAPAARPAHAYPPPAAANPAPAAPAATDAARATASFRTPAGLTLKVEPFAAEPLVANPVAFGFDEKGRAYVVETFRHSHGVTDNRNHMNWLDADLASRTVADREAMFRKYLGKEAETYATAADRLRLVEDRDGDGKADHAEVFAGGFDGLAAGLAAGVLARKGDVYFTCIPDLWLLRDDDGDGKADVRRSLHHGYGVHVAFLGHDLHGLTFGPDGKLYFSVGDRGLNVTTADGRNLCAPDTGSVLRCDPDGSRLELFATGLRNPQELAFDDAGNLFTVDNNSDSGDKARLVYLMEGGDSGWRVGYQYLERPVSRGPWNDEKLWHPRFDGQAADIVPPLANLSDGPSGLVYNPGATRLPAKYHDHFFLADFRGAANLSGVRAFTVRPDGAGFALADSEQFLWGLQATDVDFGPDGALYVSDWVEGWEITGKGRLYKVFDPSLKGDAAAPAAEVKRLLAEGFDRRPAAELARLLGHADRRVRQEAQFALAALGRGALPTFRPVAADRATGRHARLHALWGLGQIARVEPAALDDLRTLTADPEPSVRAQAAKTLGDARDPRAAAPLIALLRDGSPYVRSLAATALGKLGRRDAVGPLLQVLRENGDRDPFLRHAAVTGLAGSGDAPALAAAATDPNKSARLGALLALRRLKSPDVARFLADADPSVMTEAARAAYDEPVEAALPALAALVNRPGLPLPALRRAVQAAARVGGGDAARALARVASRSDLAESYRVEAIDALAGWPTSIGRDRIDGLWRPSRPWPADEAASALAPVLPGLLNTAPEPVRLALLRAAGPLPLAGAAPTLLALAADASRPAETRAEALRALDRLGDPGLAGAVAAAAKDREPSVRIEARRLLAKLSPEQALPILTDAVENGPVRERQGAFAALGAMPPGGADALLTRWLDRMPKGDVPPEVALDLLEAARRRADPEIARRLRALDDARPQDDPLSPYLDALVGGDPDRGGRILAEKAEVSCVRCHKVSGRGGEVGPDLSGVGARHDRRYLLESIVSPNRQIAKGFETLLLSTTDGQVRSGILKEDTGPALRLITPEGQLLTVPKSEIEDQKRGASAMPEDLTKHLTKHELRDLVEYLSTLKAPTP